MATLVASSAAFHRGCSPSTSASSAHPKIGAMWGLAIDSAWWGVRPEATMAALCSPWRSSRSALIWCTAWAFGDAGTGRARQPGEDRRAGGPTGGDHAVEQRVEPVEGSVVADVGLGPLGAAGRPRVGGRGRCHHRGALLPLRAHVGGLEERERGGDHVGVDVAQHPAAAGGVEVEAGEPELGAPLVGLAVEHEVAAHRADGRGGGLGSGLCVHSGSPIVVRPTVGRRRRRAHPPMACSSECRCRPRRVGVCHPGAGGSTWPRDPWQDLTTGGTGPTRRSSARTKTGGTRGPRPRRGA